MSRSARFPQGTFALIATRLMFYLGVQAAYFIGIVGVLTYELKASTMALAAAVGIFNLCIIVANACGGALLDVKGRASIRQRRLPSSSHRVWCTRLSKSRS